MALIMGYLKISWATSIFHQVALLATMCFCLISTPALAAGVKAKRASKLVFVEVLTVLVVMLAQSVERRPSNS